MKRHQLLSKIIEEHNRVIESLQNSVNRYKVASDLDENDISDPDDFARQTEAKDMQLRYEKMLNSERQSHDFVISENDATHSKIEDGALVETEDQIFFLGISLPHFSFDGKEVFCISEDAPIYKKIQQKNVGSKIEMGVNTLEIIAIY